MKKLFLILLLAAMATGGCTSNIRMTDITLEAGRDQMVDASGASNNTETGQLATANMKALIDAVKTALNAKKSSIIDTIKDAITGDDDEKTEPKALEDLVNLDTGAAVSPAGDVEEVD